MVHISKHDEKYWKRCAGSMQREFGGTIVIKIVHSSDPRLYPGGLWFDDFLGSITDVVGVDLESFPHLFLLADGSFVPSNCAEIVDIVQG